MKYRCGACGKKGHNRRSCSKKTTRAKRSKKKLSPKKRRNLLKRKGKRLTVAAKAALKKIFDFSSARNFRLGLNAKYAGSAPAVRLLLSRKLIRARYKYGQRYLIPTAKGRQTVRTNPFRKNARIRRAEPHRSHRVSSGTNYCEAIESGRRCWKVTREGKQYCPEHVELHPYVQQLLERLAEKEAEDEMVRLKGVGAASPHGLTSQELLNILKQHGSRTVPRLSRELQLEIGVVEDYAKALAEIGLVTIGRTSRGSKIVKLVSRRRRRYF